jgi:hypothetical protein
MWLALQRLRLRLLLHATYHCGNLQQQPKQWQPLE